uniref:Uncharacterized protein n=1 Tax=Lepeophtheirus salmonis TaxID=72036 RepID=A0A0K2TB35_LEPSM
MASNIEFATPENTMDESIGKERTPEEEQEPSLVEAPPTERKKKNLGYYFRLAMAKTRVINSIQRQRESKDSVEGDLGEVSRKTKKLSQKFNSSLQMPRGIKSDQAECSTRKKKIVK